MVMKARSCFLPAVDAERKPAHILLVLLGNFVSLGGADRAEPKVGR